LHLEPLKVKGYVHNYSENLEVVQNSSDIIERGIDISIISQISFWDALLVAAAEYSKCLEIITEDLSDRQIINGIRIRNPFIPTLPAAEIGQRGGILDPAAAP
jgi:predicted nucleic acid-binding protein